MARQFYTVRAWAASGDKYTLLYQGSAISKAENAMSIAGQTLQGTRNEGVIVLSGVNEKLQRCLVVRNGVITATSERPEPW